MKRLELATIPDLTEGALLPTGRREKSFRRRVTERLCLIIALCLITLAFVKKVYAGTHGTLFNDFPQNDVGKTLLPQICRGNRHAPIVAVQRSFREIDVLKFHVPPHQGEFCGVVPSGGYKVIDGNKFGQLNYNSIFRNDLLVRQRIRSVQPRAVATAETAWPRRSNIESLEIEPTAPRAGFCASAIFPEWAERIFDYSFAAHRQFLTFRMGMCNSITHEIGPCLSDINQSLRAHFVQFGPA